MVERCDGDISGAEVVVEIFGGGEEIRFGGLEEGFGSEDGVVSGEGMVVKVIHIFFTMEAGDEAGEVLVSGSRFVENRQVLESGDGFQSGSGDGFDADFPGLGMGAGGTVEAHVIDEGEGFMTEFGSALHESLGRGGTAKEGEVGFGEEFHFLNEGEALSLSWMSEMGLRRG